MDFLTWIRYGFPNSGVRDTVRHVYVICYMQFLILATERRMDIGMSKWQGTSVHPSI